MARYEAYQGGTLTEDGLDSIVVGRIRGPGDVEIGVFVVDAWCLGIKDAVFIPNASEEELREIVRERIPSGGQALDPACAKKLIEGAEAYAAGLGFAPARDFRKARRVLGGIDAAACAENFTFGCEGRPRFVAGPHDSPERIERVLGMLRARCGEENFDFVAFEEDAAEAEDEELQVLGATADYLRTMLDPAGPPTPSFRELCGIMAALVAGAELKESLPVSLDFLADRFVPELQGDDRKDFTSAVAIQLLRTTGDFLAAREAPEGKGNPIQMVDVKPDDRSDGVSFVIEWCRGFCRATELWPEAWREPLARNELAPHFALIRAWADPGAEGNDAFIQRESAAGRSLPAAVLALHHALHWGRDAEAAGDADVQE